MKKVIIAVAILFATIGYSQAQFKPEAGSITTEMQFVPFSQDDTPLSIDGLSLRYFLSNSFAVRLGLGFNMSTEKDYTTMDLGSGDVEELIKSTRMGFTILPGIEYHFAGFERLSPYVGAEIGVGFGSTKRNVENENHVSGAKSETKTPNFGFAFGVVTGVDFYIYRGLYMGAEFGLGMRTMKEGPVKTSTMDGKDYSKEFDFGFMSNAAIRLGWRF